MHRAGHFNETILWLAVDCGTWCLDLWSRCNQLCLYIYPISLFLVKLCKALDECYLLYLFLRVIAQLSFTSIIKTLHCVWCLLILYIQYSGPLHIYTLWIVSLLTKKKNILEKKGTLSLDYSYVIRLMIISQLYLKLQESVGRKIDWNNKNK